MSAKVSIEFRMITIRCYSCGIPFGLPDYFQSSRREDHDTFYCPNGHPGHYPQENEAERLKRELADTQKRLEFARNEARSLKEQRDNANQQLTQAKTKAARQRKRIASGVCPCCNRTFTDSRLARHIATKHPDYQGKE